MGVLGIDIGGTQIKAGIVSESGEVLRTARVGTPDSLPEFIAAMDGIVRELGTSPIEGVGIGCKPPRWLRAGDVVRVEIDKIGAIESRVVAEGA